jgi:acetolactate synthase-1/2/3 large subunit
MTEVTGGEAFLDALDSFGVECIFSSPGSEQPPIWEAIAKRHASGLAKPRYINCRHELLAVSAAWTYGHLTEKLPVVIVHTSQGLLNGSMAIRGAYRSKIPMVVVSGGSSSFGEGKFDPGAQWFSSLSDEKGPSYVAAPFVKWTGEVMSPETLEGTLRHACEIALSPPMGPSFVFIPFEFLMQQQIFARSINRRGNQFHTGPDPKLVAKLASLIAKSRKPVIITEYAGANYHDVQLLAELAESFAIPVVEAQTPDYVNFPRNHPLHQGFDAEPFLKDADLILIVGAEAPWHPPSKWPASNGKVVLIDEDPVKQSMPYFDYKIDLVVGGSLSLTLQEILKVARRSLQDNELQRSIRDRYSRLEKMHKVTRRILDDEANLSAKASPINSVWAASVLGRVIPDDAIVVEEAVSNRSFLIKYLTSTPAGSLFSADVGGLGTGFGFALGAKLAKKDKLVVAVMGDGAFNYSPVTACFGFAQEYDTPVLAVILDNSGYAAQYRHVVKFYPGGYNMKSGNAYGPKIQPRPNYVKLAEAFGAYGESVEDPSKLESVLDRAIRKVRSGQSALVDIVMEELGSSNWKAKK